MHVINCMPAIIEFPLCLQDEEHSYQRRRKLPHGTKKKGCTAAIVMREVILFPEYKVGLSLPY